jgi:hypothetical protein
MTQASCHTILMGSKTAIFNKTHDFHVRAGPLVQKFYADFKNDRKKFHRISEGSEFFD